MSCIDGFVIAVPTANKAKFREHAEQGDGVFMGPRPPRASWNAGATTCPTAR
jgi:uncharacterized protein YbaA (DUF1428 family)